MLEEGRADWRRGEQKGEQAEVELPSSVNLKRKDAHTLSCDSPGRYDQDRLKVEVPVSAFSQGWELHTSSEVTRDDGRAGLSVGVG